MATKRKTAGKKTTKRQSPARKPAGRGTTRSRTPAALAMLKRDHNEVKALFKAFERASGGRGSGAKAEGIARQICLALTVHAQIEEEIFYPAAREAIRDADLLDEATVEHASAKELIAQIEGMSADDPLFKAKVTVLGEYVNHHVREEEKEMFPAIRPRGIDLEAIAEQIMARKEELMGAAGAK